MTGWRACRRCGCYEPFAGKTDLCCYTTNGGECVFEDQTTEENNATDEAYGKGDGIGELRVDMDLTAGYEPDVQKIDASTTTTKGNTKKRRATKEILSEETDREKGNGGKESRMRRWEIPGRGNDRGR